MTNKQTQMFFAFFDDVDVIDFELINERMRVAQFSESPWGILERHFADNPPSEAEWKATAREVSNRNSI